MREFFDDQEDEKVADQIEEENSNAAEEDANDKAAQQDEIADSGMDFSTSRRVSTCPASREEHG